MLGPLELAADRRIIEWKFGDETAPQRWNEPRIVAVMSAEQMAVPVDMESLAQRCVPLSLVRAGKDEWLAPPV